MPFGFGNTKHIKYYESDSGRAEDEGIDADKEKQLIVKLVTVTTVMTMS